MPDLELRMETKAAEGRAQLARWLLSKKSVKFGDALNLKKVIGN